MTEAITRGLLRIPSRFVHPPRPCPGGCKQKQQLADAAVDNFIGMLSQDKNEQAGQKKKIKGLPLTSFRASVAGTGEVCKRTGDKRLGRDKRGMTDELLPDRSGTALEVNPGGVYFGPGLGSRAAEPCGGQGVRQRKTGETLTD